MISLKMKPSDDDSQALGVTSADTVAAYGYGTCISLSAEQCKTLGLDRLAVGQRVNVRAFGVVSRTSVEVGSGEGPESSVQLTDIEITPSSNVNVTSMYPSSKGE